LSDRTKLTTLSGARAANPRVHKIVYWLADARDRGLAPEAVIAEAQRLNGDQGARGRLVSEAMLRNLKIADGLGLLTPENRDAMRRGHSPIVTRGPYAGEPAEVDHIIPVAVAPELAREIANLEIMPRTLNRRKAAKMGARQRDLAGKLFAAGVLTRAQYDRIAEWRERPQNNAGLP
jgi:hypothetical protein